MERKIIGSCAVDSGQLLIVDPCYLSKWSDGDCGEDNDYNTACGLTLGEDMGGEMLVSGIAGTGVAVSTGWGDGSYPVEAIYKDGRVKEIRIKFF